MLEDLGRLRRGLDDGCNNRLGVRFRDSPTRLRAYLRNVFAGVGLWNSYFFADINVFNSITMPCSGVWGLYLIAKNGVVP